MGLSETFLSFMSHSALAAEVLDDFKVVINRWASHGVKKRNRFLIYELTKELFDPETAESLRRLELSKGTGKVIFVTGKWR
jgi:hypothetical protein